MTEALDMPAEISEDTISLVGDTLLGDLTKFLLDEIRAAPDVWQRLNQRQQDDVIGRVSMQCNQLIRKAVNLLASDGREVIRAQLEQLTAKDEIKAVLKLGSFDSNRHALLDAVGKPVLIVVASAEQFLGGERPKSDPDQRELPIAEDGSDDTPVADNAPATAVAA